MNRNTLFHALLLMPNDSLINNKAVSLRSSIKASVAQLDHWDALQAKQRDSCQAAKARFRSFADRLAIAKYRAKQQSFPSKQPSDPLCDRCESPFHSTGNCDIYDALEALEREDQLDSASVHQVSVHEDPSTGIYRAIVHRLCLKICELYRNSHPRFYPGPKPKKTEPQEIVYPVPLSGPDYLTITVSQASADFQGIPVHSSDIRKQRLSCLPIAHLYYSKAFPQSNC
jgi:hypothetical protein